MHLDGSFGHLVPLGVGDGEYLEVEGERFDEHAFEGPGERFAREEFHAGLGVGDRQTDQQAHDRVVDRAREAAVPGVVDHRVRVTFRADDDGGLLFSHDVEESGDANRIKVKISVQQQDVRAACCRETAF